MAPKKKGNKKGNDDWEAELGEPAPAAAGAEPSEAADDEAAAGGGGLMNLMRKNKEKRKKKGLSEDFVDGEDPAQADSSTPPVPDFTQKVAEEANLDDEFALPDKKAKGGKGNQQAAKSASAAAAADDDEDGAESGKMLTKAEKEKLKKEREKQRKKEQVCYPGAPRPRAFCTEPYANLFVPRLQRRRLPVPRNLRRPKPRNLWWRKRRLRLLRQPQRPRQVARRRRSPRIWLPSRSSKKSCDAGRRKRID